MKRSSIAGRLIILMAVIMVFVFIPESAGNVFAVEPDKTPPVVNVSSLEVTLPEGKTSVTVGDKIHFSVEITDDVGLNYAEIGIENTAEDKDIALQLAFNEESEKWEAEYEVTNNTPSGEWCVYRIYTYDLNDNSTIVYNSTLGSPSGTILEDLSSYNFTVEGTNPDKTPPVVNVSSLEVTLPEGRNSFIVGDKILFSVEITDNIGMNYAELGIENTAEDSVIALQLAFNEESEKWEAEYEVTENTPSGEWCIYRIYTYDLNNNYTTVYNSTLGSPTGAIPEDLSDYNFTVASTCKITFMVDSEFEIEPQYVAKGEKATEPTPAPAREDRIFGGWYTDEDCTDYYLFSTPVTKDITLYGKWNISLSINSYDITNGKASQGGKFTVSKGEYEDDPTPGWLVMTNEIEDEITLKAYPDEEYLFVGWYLGEYKVLEDEETGLTVEVTPLDLSDPETCISTEPELKEVYEANFCVIAVFEKCTHEFGDTLIKKATPTEDGSVYHICDKCGFNEVISTLPMASNISLDKEVYDYVGTKVEPKVTVATSDGDLSTEYYTVTYANNDNIGNATVTVTLQGDYYEGSTTLEFKIEVDKSSWGAAQIAEDTTFYVSKAGTTSAEIKGDDVTWLREESDGTSAWYGLDNSKKNFEKGSKFWVKMLSSKDEEFEKYYDMLDDDVKKEAENDKLWIFLVGVTNPDGTEFNKMELPSSLYVQLGDDWDMDDINALFIASDKDEQLFTEINTLTQGPFKGKKFAELTLEHFSPYVIYDAATASDMTPDADEYLDAANIKASQLVKNAKIADKKSGGRYQITKVTKKKGKVTGGKVTYLEPYNLDCKISTIKATVKFAGVKFKVTTINKNAFVNCKNLKKVTIGTNISKIGAGAFKGCSKLKTVIIKTTGLKSIGSKAFKGIASKATFTVPKYKYSKYKKLIKKAGAPKPKYKKK